MADVKERCHGGDAQVTDLSEFGLKDPENKLPHKRLTALLATFQPFSSIEQSGSVADTTDWRTNGLRDTSPRDLEECLG